MKLTEYSHSKGPHTLQSNGFDSSNSSTSLIIPPIWAGCQELFEGVDYQRMSQADLFLVIKSSEISKGTQRKMVGKTYVLGFTKRHFSPILNDDGN
jgi:hypothetical protein